MYAPPADALSRILEALEAAGITRDDLVARKIGSRSKLTQTFCRRKALEPELLARIAQVLDKSVAELARLIQPYRAGGSGFVAGAGLRRAFS
jgi:antitoxin component HigA of HigAB toxin-antitoxin module